MAIKRSNEAHLLHTAYMNQDLDLLRGLELPEYVASLFANEWGGPSNALKGQWPLSSNPESKCLQELLTAHRALQNVKTGAWALTTPLLPKGSSPLAAFIHTYASFSKAFYADHGEAWKTLLRLAYRALKLRKSAAINMCVFLVGHMLIIDGARRIGYMMARSSIKHSLRALTGGQPQGRFFHNIVIAAFPFSLFISMVKDADSILKCNDMLEAVSELVLRGGIRFA